MRCFFSGVVVFGSLVMADTASAATVSITTDEDVKSFEIPFGAVRRVTQQLFDAGDPPGETDAFLIDASSRLGFESQENRDEWNLRNGAGASITLGDAPGLQLVACSPVIGGCIRSDAFGAVAGPAPHAEFIRFIHSLHI